MNRADTRAALHCDHRFNAHRHVNDDTIAHFDAARLQAVGELAYPCVQVAVIYFGNLAIIRLENDRGLVGPGGKMRIQAVV